MKYHILSLLLLSSISLYSMEMNLDNDRERTLQRDATTEDKAMAEIIKDVERHKEKMRNNIRIAAENNMTLEDFQENPESMKVYADRFKANTAEIRRDIKEQNLKVRCTLCCICCPWFCPCITAYACQEGWFNSSN